MKWTIIQITDEKTQCCQLVMGCDQNLRELSVNVISHFSICVKRNIHEWQFSTFIVNLSDQFVYFNVIFGEIADITWIGRKWEFMA